MGRTAPSRIGLRNLLECQEVASGPVSASPSPTQHGDDQVGVVEGGAEGVRERVAELAAFVNGAGSFGRAVAADASGEGEVPEELEHAVARPGSCPDRPRSSRLRGSSWRASPAHHGRGRRCR